LMPLVYDELRKLAAGYMRRERPGQTLQATALVHDVYLRLLKDSRLSWQNRAHFFGIAARSMRQILVERARTRGAAKRGGSRVREISEAARVRPAPERDAFVEHACSGDAGLRAEVTSLLSAHDEATDFIEAPVYEAAPDLFVDDGTDVSGRPLGHYIIRH